MLTFYHSPWSRSTRVLGLLCAMERLDAVDLRVVSIPRAWACLRGLRGEGATCPG